MQAGSHLHEQTMPEKPAAFSRAAAAPIPSFLHRVIDKFPRKPGNAIEPPLNHKLNKLDARTWLLKQWNTIVKEMRLTHRGTLVGADFPEIRALQQF